MKQNQTFIIAALSLAALLVYLFVSAPTPLPQTGQSAQGMVTNQALFNILAAENAAIRSLYTSEIVGPGLKQGLKFQEGWKSAEVNAGPLPALMLREMSGILQRDMPDISLFLGSDYPIVPANLFKGVQVEHFQQLRASKKPQFFKDESTGRYTAMYPDLAVAQACVKCHNEHSKTPKTDWALNDIMGATTWLYPRQKVAVPEVLKAVRSLRQAGVETYSLYLKKVAGFEPDKRPTVGKQWPKEGFYLPDAATFQAEMEKRNAQTTLKLILQLQEKEHASSVSASSPKPS